jgi:hypothetical protein
LRLLSDLRGDRRHAGRGAWIDAGAAAVRHLGSRGDLLNDPPGFDRSGMADVDRKIAGFFVRYGQAIKVPVGNAATADVTD